MKAILLCALALPIAGCAGLPPRWSCTGEWPLELVAHPDVQNASLIRTSVQLWNCTGRTLILDGSDCAPTDALRPTLSYQGISYVLTWNETALPRDSAGCEDPLMEQGPVEIPPGGTRGREGARWNGRFATPEGEVHAPGKHLMFVDAAGYQDVEEVTIE